MEVPNFSFTLSEEVHFLLWGIVEFYRPAGLVLQNIHLVSPFP
jgi:hypothetical protein